MTAPDDTGDRDEADDPIMRSMRSVWVSMRDEDPPTKGLTELLAAARSKAEEMQPKESWWRRTLATLVRPPVLALATVVVLVGGTVMIANRSADSELVPVAHAPASSRDELQDRDRKPESIDRLDKGVVEPRSESAAANAANDSPPTIVPSPPAETKPPMTRPTRPPVNPRVTRDPEAPKDPERGGKFGSGEDATVSGLGSGQAAQGPLVGRTPEPPPRPGLEIANGDLAGETTDKAPSSDPGRPKDDGAKVTTQPRTGPSPVEQLVKQAEAAAERKDCPAVRVTVNRIKKLDSNVYKDRVVKQAAIARCLK